MQSHTSIFTPLERTLLGELRSRLRFEAAELFAQQLERINWVQRDADSREVCYYSLKKGAVHHDPRIQFPANVQELKLATMNFISPRHEKTWTANFFLVQGYFFSVVFDRNPQEIEDCDTLRIEQVQVHCDPMLVGLQDVETRRAMIPPQFPNWVGLLSGQVSEVYEPLEKGEKEVLLRHFGDRFPTDYLDLVECCEGLSVGNWSIFGLSQVYDIVLPEGDYYVLAELHGCGVLAVDPRDGSLYYWDYGGSNPVPMGRSLFAALDSHRAAGSS